MYNSLFNKNDTCLCKNLTKMQIVPCRISFIFARQEPTAIILVRTHIKWVRLIRWNIKNDSFEFGHWFHGTINPHHCDLSPDGSLFIYFAATYHPKDTSTRGTWVAISKPPWLTALALWPIGDAWGGDCTFIDNKRIWIQPGLDKLELHPEFHLQGLQLVTEKGYDWNWRMYRDDWQPQLPANYRPNRAYFYLPWTKLSLDKKYLLTRIYNQNRVNDLGGGFGNSFEFNLTVLATEQTFPLENANWADWDARGRLIFSCRTGKLWTANLQESKFQPREIYDFNGQYPEPIVPPESARQW